MLVFEEIFKRGFMVMDRDKNVGTFNLPVVSGFVAKRKEKMLSFAWMAGNWRAVNTVRATPTTPAYEDKYEYTCEMADEGARLVAVRAGGKKFPYLTFDAFSGRWMMTFTEVIYGVLQAKEWVGSQIVFTGPLTMLGVDCELRQTLTKKSENDFHILNEERLPDSTWSIVDELMFKITGRLSYKGNKVMEHTRRQFLKQSTMVVASGVVCPRFAEAIASPTVKFPTETRERIAIASYPFRDFILGGEKKPVGPSIDLKDFAAHVNEKFGVRKIEPWTGHFASTDPKYLEQFREAVERSKGFVANMAVDGEDSPYAVDASERARAVAFSKKWIDVAAFLGAPGIRTNLPSAKDSEPNLDRTADSLQRVLEYASAKNVVVNLENDNPVSEDPFFLVKLVEKVGNPWLHTLPDFANSLAHRDAEYAYKGFGEMCPHAYSICHVKAMELNDAGKPVEVDMARAFGLLKQGGFKGYCSMEFDSPGDPYAGTRALIEKTELLLR